MADKECEKCGRKLGKGYLKVTEDRELVVVDEQIQEAYVLNKDDCLCDVCGKVVTYYRRIR